MIAQALGQTCFDGGTTVMNLACSQRFAYGGLTVWKVICITDSAHCSKKHRRCPGSGPFRGHHSVLTTGGTVPRCRSRALGKVRKCEQMASALHALHKPVYCKCSSVPQAAAKVWESRGALQYMHDPAVQQRPGPCWQEDGD